MIGENTSLYQYYTAAGTAVAGMPETIPPTGMGQSTVGVTVAGIPNISTLTAGAVSTAGQIAAGVTVAGMPDTIPPTGVGTAGTVSGKICIATTGATINSPIADIFDKAPYFLIVGFGNMEVVQNPNVQDLIGSGVQSAQLVVSEGSDVVITNDIGIKAIEELHRLQVKVYTGVTGTAKDALEWYQNNRLTPTKLNSSSDQVNDDEEDEEQHGPPSGSKSKAKGDTKGESTTL